MGLRRGFYSCTSCKNPKIFSTILLFFLGIFFFSSLVFAAEINDTFHINLQTTFSNGTIQNGSFTFGFNITESSSASCLSPIVYNYSTSLTTDSRGIASIYLPQIGSNGGNLSSLGFDKQYYLCYYRDGTLKDVTQLARVPYSFRATQVNLSEVTINSNLNLTGYNVTANYGFFSFLGNLTNRITSFFVQDINATGSINTTGNVTASWFLGNINASNIQNAPWSTGESNWNANYSNFSTLYGNQLGNASNFTTLYANQFGNNSNLTTIYGYALNSSLWTLNYSDYLTVRSYALNDSLWTLNYSNFTTIYSGLLGNASNFTTIYGNQLGNASNMTTIYANVLGNATNLYNNYTNLTTIYSNLYTNYTNFTTLYANQFGNNSNLTTIYGYALNDSLWTLNYSTFLTHITWANAVNGTLALNSSLADYVKTANWNATNTSYYLTSNPSGFFNNITNFTGTLTDTKYCIYDGASGKIVCNSGSGAITESDPYWTGNYSNFTTTYGNQLGNASNMTTIYGNQIGNSSNMSTLYANQYNNASNMTTIYGYALNDSLWTLNYSNFTTIYGYALGWQNNASNFSRVYANVTDYNASWSNITNMTYHTGSLYATNGTYYLATNPNGYISWATANNGTLLNYSSALNGTLATWANVGNGTVAFWSNVVNGTVVLNSTLADYMKTANWNATNTSYYLATNPFGFYNVTGNNFTTFNISAGNFTINNQTSYNLFVVNGTNGRVGIGTNVSQNALDVNGTINASLSIFAQNTKNLSIGYDYATNSSNEANWNANYTNFSTIYAGLLGNASNLTTLYGNQLGNASNFTTIYGNQIGNASNFTTIYGNQLGNASNMTTMYINDFSFFNVTGRNFTTFNISAGNFTINNQTSYNLFVVNGTNGRVGIGTNVSQNALDVNGTINASLSIFAQNTKNLSVGYDYALNGSTFTLNYSNFSTLYGNQIGNASNFTTIYGNQLGNASNMSTLYANQYNNASNMTTIYGYALNASLWTLNYSTFLTHITWAQANNGTLLNYSNALNGTLVQNSTLVDYMKTANWNATNTSYRTLDNLTFIGSSEFNGGWQNGGLSIIGGDIFAQTAYLVNLTSLGVSNLNVNGSLIPYFDNQFDLGNITFRWRDLSIGRNANISGTLNVSGTIYAQNTKNLSIGYDYATNSSNEANWNANYSNFSTIYSGLLGNASNLTTLYGNQLGNASNFTTIYGNQLGNASNMTTMYINDFSFFNVTGRNFTTFNISAGNFTINNQTSYNLFVVNGTNGRVGIGTNVSQNALDVNGTINASLSIFAQNTKNLSIGYDYATNSSNEANWNANYSNFSTIYSGLLGNASNLTTLYGNQLGNASNFTTIYGNQLGNASNMTTMYINDFSFFNVTGRNFTTFNISAGNFTINNQTSYNLFVVNGTNGRVGIGTNVSQNALDVNGTINASLSIFAQNTKNLSIGYDYATNSSNEANWNANYTNFSTIYTGLLGNASNLTTLYGNQLGNASNFTTIYGNQIGNASNFTTIYGNQIGNASNFTTIYGNQIGNASNFTTIYGNQLGNASNMTTMYINDFSFFNVTGRNFTTFNISAGNFTINNQTSYNLFVVNGTNGRVGIGTNVSQNALDVNGTINASLSIFAQSTKNLSVGYDYALNGSTFTLNYTNFSTIYTGLLGNASNLTTLYGNQLGNASNFTTIYGNQLGNASNFTTIYGNQLGNASNFTTIYGNQLGNASNFTTIYGNQIGNASNFTTIYGNQIGNASNFTTIYGNQLGNASNMTTMYINDFSFFNVTGRNFTTFNISAGNFTINNQTSYNLFVVNGTNGRVGIGTNVSQNALDVNGTINASLSIFAQSTKNLSVGYDYALNGSTFTLNYTNFSTIYAGLLGNASNLTTLYGNQLGNASNFTTIYGNQLGNASNFTTIYGNQIGNASNFTTIYGNQIGNASNFTTIYGNQLGNASNMTTMYINDFSFFNVTGRNFTTFNISAGNFTINNQTSYNLFVVNGTNGRVGIGTNVSQNALDVNGTINASLSIFAQSTKNLSVGYDYALNGSTFTLNYTNFSTIYAGLLGNASNLTTLYGNQLGNASNFTTIYGNQLGNASNFTTIYGNQIGNASNFTTIYGNQIGNASNFTTIYGNQLGNASNMTTMYINDFSFFNVTGRNFTTFNISAGNFTINNQTSYNLFVVNGTNGRVGIGTNTSQNTLNLLGTFNVTNGTNSIPGFVIDDQNRIGIKTSSPTNELSVSGNASITGNLSIAGASATDNTGALALGVKVDNTKYKSGIFVTDNFAQGTGTNGAYIAAYLSNTGAAGKTGLFIDIDSPAFNTDPSSIRGQAIGAEIQATAGSNNSVGIESYSYNLAKINTGTSYDFVAFNYLQDNGSGYTNQSNHVSYASYGQSAVAPTYTTNLYDFYAKAYSGIANHQITNRYGLYIDFTNQNITNAYGVYQINDSVKNYFGGKVGINDTSPLSSLHINSSLATGSLRITNLTNNHLLVNGSTGYVGIGTLSPNSTLHVSGIANITSNLSVDTDTFFVDSSTNRVGISSTSPSVLLGLGTGIGDKLAVYDAAGSIYGFGIGSGRIYVKANGAEVLQVTSSNTVGILTSTPQNALNVIGDSNTSGTVYAQNTKNLSVGYDYALNGTLSTGITWATAYNGTLAKTDAANTFGAFNQTFDTRLFFIDSTDKMIGINTTNPNATLNINSSFINGSLRITNLTSEHFFINGSTGRVGIGTMGPTAKLEIVQPNGVFGTANPYLRFDYDGTKILHTYMDSTWGVHFDASNANGDLLFDTNGGNRLALNENGNVGVNTTTPQNILNVFGDSNSTGTVYAQRTKNLSVGYDYALNGTLSTGITWATAYNGTLAKTDAANTFGAFNQTFDSKLFFIDSTDKRIGINTTQPTSTLHINSSLAAGAFKVEDTLGNSSLFVNGSSTYVGIGTGAPQNKLHILTSNSATEGIRLERGVINNFVDIKQSADVSGDTLDLVFQPGTATTYGYLFKTYDATSNISALSIDRTGKIGVNTTAPLGTLNVNSSLAAGSLRISNLTKEHLFINGSTGRVGIGLTNPDEALRVLGNIAVSTGTAGNYGQIFHDSGSTGSFFFNNKDSGNIIWQNSGTEQMRLTSSDGKLNVNGSIQTGANFMFSGSNAYILKNGDDIQFYNGNGVGVTVKNSTSGYNGGLGVGTASPNGTLEVNGSINSFAQLTLTNINSTSKSYKDHFVFNVSRFGYGYGFPQNSNVSVLSIRAVNDSGSGKNVSRGLLLFGEEDSNAIDTFAVLGPNTANSSNLGGQGAVFSIYTHSSDFPFVAYDAFSGQSCSLTYSGGASCTSDERLKKNIEPLSDTLEKVKSLEGVHYQWKYENGTEKHIGFIAQNVQKIFPELVTNNTNGTLMVSYERFAPILVEALKELANNTLVIENLTKSNYNRTLALENITALLENRTFILENKTRVIENRTAVIENRTTALENVTSLIDERLNNIEVQNLSLEIKNLKEENDMIKMELCKKDSSYSWCNKT